MAPAIGEMPPPEKKASSTADLSTEMSPDIERGNDALVVAHKFPDLSEPETIWKQ